MFLRHRLPRHSAYDDTFFWSGECRDNEVRMYNYQVNWSIYKINISAWIKILRPPIFFFKNKDSCTGLTIIMISSVEINLRFINLT